VEIAGGLGGAGVEPLKVGTVVGVQKGFDGAFVAVDEACRLCEVKRPVAGMFDRGEVRVEGASEGSPEKRAGKVLLRG
jgi:hypothetical protein